MGQHLHIRCLKHEEQYSEFCWISGQICQALTVCQEQDRGVPPGDFKLLQLWFLSSQHYLDKKLNNKLKNYPIELANIKNPTTPWIVWLTELIHYMMSICIDKLCQHCWNRRHFLVDVNSTQHRVVKNRNVIWKMNSWSWFLTKKFKKSDNLSHIMALNTI